MKIARLLAACFLLALVAAHAGTTIDPSNRFAYGANAGWMDWVADTNNGAVIGEYVCSGNIYAANLGWINLGNGSPANGVHYQNNSATDYGVNVDALGNLSGYAYGANIGWLNFETNGGPRVDLLSGRLSGDVWSANCGWISLSNVEAMVQADVISPGPLAANGLPIAWLLSNFGVTNLDANADPTGKGMTIAQDYLAGTNPNDTNSVLQITGADFSVGGTNVMLSWASVPTRFYEIMETSDLTSTNWVDSSLGLVSPSGGSNTTAVFTDSAPLSRFYRIEAVRPLTP